MNAKASWTPAWNKVLMEVENFVGLMQIGVGNKGDGEGRALSMNNEDKVLNAFIKFLKNLSFE